jgi:hypothetical protein
MNAHHLNARSCFGSRYELKNGVCLCSSCHRHEAHNRPYSFLMRLIANDIITQAELNELDSLSRMKVSGDDGRIPKQFYIDHINKLELYVKTKEGKIKDGKENNKGKKKEKAVSKR